MHMADTLLNPTVGAVMYGFSAVAAGYSIKKIRTEELAGESMISKKIPQMAVMSSLVFAGQMINYSIPGTGSSGHLCGGMLLTAILGPYAGFLSMIVVLTIQCLMFADGGIMALGANVWNMAFYGCFIGYFLIWNPIMKSFSGKKNILDLQEKSQKRMGIILASVLGCILTLQLGAFSVVIETSLSGVTDIPFGAFILAMQPIHLAIGLVEGLITAAVLVFVYENSPQIISTLNLDGQNKAGGSKTGSAKTVLVILAVTTVFIGGGLSLLASSKPDGLEWSLERLGQIDEADEETEGGLSALALFPDYSFRTDDENILGTSTSGVVGAGIVAVVSGAVCAVASFAGRKKENI